MFKINTYLVKNIGHNS